jgi:spore coat protein U-like protein
LTQIREKFIQLSVEHGESRHAPCREAIMNLANTCRILGAATLLIGVAAAPAAQAGQATGTLSVSASVAATCSVNSPSLGFGAYDKTNGTTASTTVTVTCTAASGTASVALGQGANWDGTNNTRRLKEAASGNYLAYGLYSDSSFTTAWGDGTAATNNAAAVSNSETGSAVNTTVYGKIPANQSLFAGSFSDSVSITVTF